MDEKTGSLVSFYEFYLREQLTLMGFRYILDKNGRFRLWYRQGKPKKMPIGKVLEFSEIEREEN